MNYCWSIDFTEEQLMQGRKFRSFTVIDDANREVLYVESDFTLPSGQVLWLLNHLIKRRGKPRRIRMDNGPEFTAKKAKEWSDAHEIEFNIYTAWETHSERLYRAF